MSWYCMCSSKNVVKMYVAIIMHMLSTQGVSTYSSVEENDSCDGREYVHSNSEEGKGH